MKRIYKVLAALLCVAFLMPVTSVQALEIDKQYINNNRSHQYLKPIGVVIHDTDNPGATAQNNRDYFNRVYVAASAHYFVDWNKTIQTIPENEVAWHAGYTANHRYLSIEICMPRGYNPLQFNAAYNRAVELTSDMCKRYGWDTSKIYSHYWCSYTFKQTDHEDPIAFFREYGKSMDSFKNDVAARIGQAKTTYSAPVVSNNISSAKSGFTYANNAKVSGDDLYIRDSEGNRQYGHYVSDGDNITVLDISYSKQLVKVEYPTASGVRTGYVKNVPSLIHYYYQSQYKNGSTSEPVYIESNCNSQYGSLDPRESATVLYRQGERLCVVYNTTKGQNTKNGFVKWNDHFNKF